MIDLKNDLQISDEDIAILKQMEKRRSRSLSMDKYIEFLRQTNQMFPQYRQKKLLSYNHPFTLPSVSSRATFL